MYTKKRVLYHLGNFLIGLSLLGFAFIFFPYLQIYFFPPKMQTIQKAQAQTETFISIPKIHAQSPIIEQVNPWNEAEYQQVLKKGVAHARGTSLPGQPGTIFLFAHSSGTPWEMTWTNTIFLRLNELQKGDRIEIRRKGKQYNYIVRGKKEVDPTAVNYLLQTTRTQLILQTCTPIGTSLRRLLVFADPLK